MMNLGKEVTGNTTVKNEEFGRRNERKRLYRDGSGRHVHGRGDGNPQPRRYNNGEDRGQGKHINNGRRDGIGPHFEEGCNVHPTHETKPEDRGHRFQNENTRRNRRSESIIETRLFTDKEELVKYVNEGETANKKYEIYKIEENLYKLQILK
jgi:hypothetical protein